MGTTAKASSLPTGSFLAFRGKSLAAPSLLSFWDAFEVSGKSSWP